MKDKVESGFGMNDEKKYFYALNEMGFKYGSYRKSISELKRAYPKLKAGDTISRAEICKPKLEDHICALSIVDEININYSDDTGCDDPIIIIPRDRWGDVEKRIAEILEPFSVTDTGYYWGPPEDYILTEKDLEDEC